MSQGSEHHRLAHWATTLNSADIPHDVEQWVRLAFLDFLGLLTAGHHAISGRLGGLVLHQPVESAGLTPRSTDPLERARHAYHLARAANVLDGDDGHNLAGAAHIGSTVFATLVAAAEPLTPYAELLTAAVIGYEVGIRAGADPIAGGAPSVASASGAAASIGATASLARLRRLDANEFARALDISLTRAPISALSDRSMRESIGWAAYTAILNVETVSANPSAGVDAEGTALFTASLGQGPTPTWVGEPGAPFLLTGSYRKPYAACRVTHAAIDGIRQLQDRHHLDPGTITDIMIETTSFGALLQGPAPGTIDDGVFHYPTIAALSVIGGGPTVEDWINERHRDPQVIALASRVRVAASSWADSFQPESYPARVSITARERFVTEVIVPTGSPGPSHALTSDQVAQKAALGLRHLLDAASIDELVDAVLRVRDISLGALVPFIVPPVPTLFATR